VGSNRNKSRAQTNSQTRAFPKKRFPGKGTVASLPRERILRRSQGDCLTRFIVRRSHRSRQNGRGCNWWQLACGCCYQTRTLSARGRHLLFPAKAWLSWPCLTRPSPWRSSSTPVNFKCHRPLAAGQVEWAAPGDRVALGTGSLRGDVAGAAERYVEARFLPSFSRGTQFSARRYSMRSCSR
jgi:hypothetical protein